MELAARPVADLLRRAAGGEGEDQDPERGGAPGRASGHRPPAGQGGQPARSIPARGGAPRQEYPCSRRGSQPESRSRYSPADVAPGSRRVTMPWSHVSSSTVLRYRGPSISARYRRQRSWTLSTRRSEASAGSATVSSLAARLSARSSRFFTLALG